ncbi:serine/threonine protein kinase [Alkalibacillus aidingensis]|uniref:serine/threonine protein kinase n=1 Tax=Alkalibacillus aidingensis TaxID=2747607 RepID=UPI001660F3D2|nr:protein kinase family protein [Alkalibacillus aidingensis]
MSSIHPTVNLYKGDRLKGVWNHRSYRIERLLGEGARGSTYLASWNQQTVALKISKDPSVVTAESNVLRKLNKVQGVKLGPSLLDVDDTYIRQGSKYSFYVMEYVKGLTLKDWFEQHSTRKLGDHTSQLLNYLHELHRLGYAYGDFKPDNIIIEQKTNQLRLVDVGGVTKFGRAVREYTTIYDRGYWRLGSRKADATYDLFSLAICMIQADSNQKLKQASKNKSILKRLPSFQTITPYHEVIRKALLGSYSQALSMKKEVDHINRKLLTMRQKSTNHRYKKRKPTTTHAVDHTEVIGVTSVVAIHLTILYVLIQTL